MVAHQQQLHCWLLLSSFLLDKCVITCWGQFGGVVFVVWWFMEEDLLFIIMEGRILKNMDAWIDLL
jgi:hypothetical protein